jgi:hypothetical protein
VPALATKDGASSGLPIRRPPANGFNRAQHRRDAKAIRILWAAYCRCYPSMRDLPSLHLSASALPPLPQPPQRDAVACRAGKLRRQAQILTERIAFDRIACRKSASRIVARSISFLLEMWKKGRILLML